MNMKVLIAEDERQLSDVESAFLKLRGFEVHVAENGLVAVRMTASDAYDAIVLDIMMPEMDGIEALKRIRASGNTTPVIMLTAKAEVDDRVEGLTSGADDYLTKPFALKELEARLRAQIRRTDQFSAGTLQYGDITLNLGEQELSSRSAIRLAGKETRLMEFLMRNAGLELLPETVYAHVWNESTEYSASTVRLYLSYLQGKLNAIASDVQIESGDRIRLYRMDDAP